VGWLYLLLAVVAGACIPFQAGINAQAAHWLSSPIRAAFVSFAVGLVALLVASIVILKPLPSAARLGDAPWWVWLGGLGGAFYVVGSTASAPKLGAATLIAAVVAGQTVASVFIDHFGWVGFAEHHITPSRLIGMGLVAAGVVVVRFA
jgi:transporter family-2 protein